MVQPCREPADRIGPSAGLACAIVLGRRDAHITAAVLLPLDSQVSCRADTNAGLKDEPDCHLAATRKNWGRTVTHGQGSILTREKISSSMPSSRLSIVHLCIEVEQSTSSGGKYAYADC